MSRVSDKQIGTNWRNRAPSNLPADWDEGPWIQNGPALDANGRNPGKVETRTAERDRLRPEPGTRAFTAMCMAEIAPQDGDPDFWDRWKDDEG